MLVCENMYGGGWAESRFLLDKSIWWWCWNEFLCDLLPKLQRPSQSFCIKTEHCFIASFRDTGKDFHLPTQSHLWKGSSAISPLTPLNPSHWATEDLTVSCRGQELSPFCYCWTPKPWEVKGPDSRSPS